MNKKDYLRPELAIVKIALSRFLQTSELSRGSNSDEYNRSRSFDWDDGE